MQKDDVIYRQVAIDAIDECFKKVVRAGNECPVCGIGSDCDYNFCMRCGTKLARAKKG